MARVHFLAEGAKTKARLTAEKEDEKLKVRFVVDKQRSRIIYMEAGKEVVEMVLAFMAMPLAKVLNGLKNAATSENNNTTTNNREYSCGTMSNAYESMCELMTQGLVTTRLSNYMDLNSSTNRNININNNNNPCASNNNNPGFAAVPGYLAPYACDNPACNRFISYLAGQPCPACSSSTKMNRKLSVAGPNPDRIVTSKTGQLSAFLSSDYLPFIITDDLSILPSTSKHSVAIIAKYFDKKTSMELSTVEAIILPSQITQMLHASFGSLEVLNFVFKHLVG